MRRITLADGRYLIFYSFEPDNSNSDRERLTELMEAAPAAHK
ncbi:MAG TPA: hypothetical protein VFH31_20730 [Pyrinomonadaceae bacterium]|nr:hypothetical protein [Pyrinomonadaceae bacterium]